MGYLQKYVEVKIGLRSTAPALSSGRIERNLTERIPLKSAINLYLRWIMKGLPAF